jgi:hypothetical protein
MNIGTNLSTPDLPVKNFQGIGKLRLSTNHPADASKDLWFLGLWCLYLILKPFYLFESGMPQIADYLVVMLVFLTFISRQMTLKRSLIPILSKLAALMGYFVAVDATWAFISGETEILLYACYYIFNFLGCLLFAWCYSRFDIRFLNWTAVATFVSLCLQMVLSSGVLGRHESRATIYFNNPNQLGYYTILFGSIFWLWTQTIAKRSLQILAMELVFYGSMIYLTCLTLSRAALASIGVLLLLRLAMRSRMIIVLLVITCYMAISSADIEIIENFKQRVESKNIGTEEELFHRGYDRLINEPQYLLFGAGEGANWRFWGDYKIELHSSLGTVLFCYGIVGLALFLRLYLAVGQQAGWQALAYLIPVSLYGLTHNGLRQLEFWMLILLIVAIFKKISEKESKRISTKNRPLRANARTSHA